MCLLLFTFYSSQLYLWPAGYCLIIGSAWQRHFLDNLFVSTCETRVIIAANDPKERISKARGCKFNSFSLCCPGFVRGYTGGFHKWSLDLASEIHFWPAAEIGATRRYNRQGKFEKNVSVFLEFSQRSCSTWSSRCVTHRAYHVSFIRSEYIYHI